MKATKEDVLFLSNIRDSIIEKSKTTTSEQEKEELTTLANRIRFIQVDVVENDVDSKFQKFLKARINLG